MCHSLKVCAVSIFNEFTALLSGSGKPVKWFNACILSFAAATRSSRPTCMQHRISFRAKCCTSVRFTCCQLCELYAYTIRRRVTHVNFCRLLASQCLATRMCCNACWHKLSKSTAMRMYNREISVCSNSACMHYIPV